ncbi:MAG: sigma-54-dependent Fis family transcriptional regulator [Candidatus Cloacimonetes bacterium]|nr:sigma-54-dependent Fis family transcriptional regulator [Candidatus Cloacimonadota bacterium]
MDKILIVDDNTDMQFLLSNILSEEGYETFSAGNGNRAITEVKRNNPDLVLLDIRLPGMDGLRVLEEIRKINPEILVIMITAFGDIKSAVQAMKDGAFDYVTKPFDNEALILNIKKAMKTKHLSDEVEDLKKQLQEQKEIKFLGESPQMKMVLKQVDLVAPTNMSLIIQGKSGTGKEVIAKLIHKRSSRKDKPFIAVDCGSIPETLVESELFGHEKGSFTGADSLKKGQFELAHGGTLLLDELTNLPFDAQAKLLRAIEERQIIRIGGKKPIRIDVRIIATTNLDIIQTVQDGKFRDDLFHRLNEFQITLPLLNQRKEDIPILARKFLQDSNKDLNKTIKDFSSESINRLINYQWPGNIRELKHVIKRAVLLTESGNITPDKLVLNVVKPHDEVSISESFDKGETYDDIIRRVEKDLILKAIDQAGGNKTKAAEMLNMNRKTFYRKMNSLGIQGNQES